METQSFLDLPGAQALASEIKAYIAQQQQQLLLAAFPVGTVIENTTGTNPGDYLGGSWEQYGQGRVTVGRLYNDQDFIIAGQTGGEKEVTLDSTQMPYHDHSTTVYGGYYFYGGEGTSNGPAQGNGYRTEAVGLRTGNAGGGQPHNNMPPYIVVYRWRRTA